MLESSLKFLPFSRRILIFPKFLLEGLGEIRGGILTTSACFPSLVDSTLLLGFLFVIFRVNLEVAILPKFFIKVVRFQKIPSYFIDRRNKQLGSLAKSLKIWNIVFSIAP